MPTNNAYFCHSEAILQQSKNKTRLQLSFLLNLVLSTQKATNDHIKKGALLEYIHIKLAWVSKGLKKTDAPTK